MLCEDLSQFIAAINVCGNIEEEWSCVKKFYFKKIRVVHPDRGGCAEQFKIVNTSFEALRVMFEHKKIDSFSVSIEARLTTCLLMKPSVISSHLAGSSMRKPRRLPCRTTSPSWLAPAGVDASVR